MVLAANNVLCPNRWPARACQYRAHELVHHPINGSLYGFGQIATQIQGALIPWCSCTVRTACSGSSGEKRFYVVFMAPSSQSLEPPHYPGQSNSKGCTQVRLSLRSSRNKPASVLRFKLQLIAQQQETFDDTL